MIDTETIGKIIKKLRVDKQMTQEELAEKIDISTNYLSKVERGLSRLNIEAFLKMAEILSFSLNDFGINTTPEHQRGKTKQELLKKVLSIPEKDAEIYLITISCTEDIIAKLKK